MLFLCKIRLKYEGNLIKKKKNMALCVSQSGYMSLGSVVLMLCNDVHHVGSVRRGSRRGCDRRTIKKIYSS